MKKFSRFVNWGFAIAFIILVNLFLYYTINVISPEPRYENFCPIHNESYMTAETCVSAGGQWTNFQMSPKEVTDAVKTNSPLGWCDADFTCRQTFESTTSTYNKNVFVVMIVVSLVLMIIGIFIKLEILSISLTWSGVVALIVATIRFWSDAGNGLKVVILGIGIVVLLWLAIKKLKDE